MKSSSEMFAEAIEAWRPETAMEACAAARFALDRRDFARGGILAREAERALAQVYLDHFLSAEGGRAILSRVISGLDLESYSAWAIGVIACTVACDQARADLDLVFFDNDGFDDRVCEGIDPDHLL